MSDQQKEIARRGQELGLDQHGLLSIRNFIASAFYHVALPGTPPADKHLAWDHAIRRATNRIACQGHYGGATAKSRLLSQGAIDLRDQILADKAIERRRKFGVWVKAVTEEHQDPVVAIETWINEDLPSRTVDDVVHRLLTHPSVIVTREEERRIPSRYKFAGLPSERYAEAKIVVAPVQERGTFEFFGGRHLTKTKYPRMAECS